MEQPPPKKTKIIDSPFKSEWELFYFFISCDDKVKCLICGKFITCVRKSSIERHYKHLHFEKYNAIKGAAREEELRKLKVQNLEEELSLSTDEVEKEDQGCDEATLRASYKVALNLARAGKPFIEGPLIKSILVDVVEIMNPTLAPSYSKIPMSRMTITRRISDIAGNLRDQLAAKIENFLAYSIALDESTDISDTAQLAIFLRGVDDNLLVTEELLDMVSMKGTTTGADILDAVETAAEEIGLPWEKLFSVTTDGAPAMRGRVKGFIGLLRKKLNKPDLLSIHCFAHQEALCAKVLGFEEVMKVLVRIVNYIRSHGLTHRQFKEFLDEVEKEYPDIPYYTEVRWLSKGKVIFRFFRLRQSVAEFLEEKGRPEPLLTDPEWVADVGFLADITALLNDLSLKLQKENQLINDMISKIKAFQQKLHLLRNDLLEQNTSHFPELASVREGARFEKYVEVIQSLENEFSERFQDITVLQPILDVFVKPFSIAVESVPSNLQFEIIDLQNDDRRQDLFYKAKSLLEFYQNLPKEDFPKLHREAAQAISMFGSTCICERFFSVLTCTKTKLRASISDRNLNNALRIAVSRSLVPDITGIIKKKTERTKKK